MGAPLTQTYRQLTKPVAYATGTSATVTYSATPKGKTALLCAVAVSNTLSGATTITATPTGWTQLFSRSGTSGTNTFNLFILGRESDGAEASTFSVAGTGTRTWALIEFAGIIPGLAVSGGLFQASTGNTSSGASGTLTDSGSGAYTIPRALWGCAATRTNSSTTMTFAGGTTDLTMTATAPAIATGFVNTLAPGTYNDTLNWTQTGSNPIVLGTIGIAAYPQSKLVLPYSQAVNRAAIF